MNTFYIVAIQGSGVAEITSADCLYLSYRQAEEKLKWYHDNKMDYMRIFHVRSQDDDVVAQKQAAVLCAGEAHT